MAIPSQHAQMLLYLLEQFQILRCSLKDLQSVNLLKKIMIMTYIEVYTEKSEEVKQLEKLVRPL